MSQAFLLNVQRLSSDTSTPEELNDYIVNVIVVDVSLFFDASIFRVIEL